MNKRTEKQIEQIYKTVFNKVFNKQSLAKARQGNLTSVKNIVHQIETSKKYKEFAKKFANKLAKAGLTKQRGMWKKYFKAAKAQHVVAIPSSYTEYEKQILAKLVEKNFKMITSVPQKVLNVYKQKDVQTVIKQIATGSLGRGSFEKALKNHGYKNAKLIARTESAKLQTAVDELNATELGSVCYEWLSSNDKRTRQSHKEMNKVIVFWRPDNEKPLLDNMRGNAGEFPNCRCTTLAILDENDLKRNKYKLYNYKTDKIEEVSKEELLEYIKIGEIK